MMKVLGIETSCDETACGIVEDGRTVQANFIYSQANEHAKYGGIIPELASRRQIEEIVNVYESALAEAKVLPESVDVIAVTTKPGLIGSLLVGVNFAKALAFYYNKPIVAVDHILGHIAANYITYPELEPPFLCLTVSGGHTSILLVETYTSYKIIGTTYDDAAGEAFDKVGRALGLEYPAGQKIDELAALGNSKRYILPRPKVEGHEFDFSFSGLKTAVINTLHNLAQRGEQVIVEDMAASFQNVVVEILTEKFIKAAFHLKINKLCLSGGVSANKQLRSTLEQKCRIHGFNLFMPKLEFCGDNGAMIASQGYYEFKGGHVIDLKKDDF